jgi:hypothetical protein
MNDETGSPGFQENSGVVSPPAHEGMPSPSVGAASLNFPWQKSYLDAVLETSDAMLLNRIVAAQNVLRARTAELAQDHHGSKEEQHAIAKAMNGLTTMRQERLID